MASLPFWPRLRSGWSGRRSPLDDLTRRPDPQPGPDRLRLYREMTYRLTRLAPGSYDVLLNGVIIASLVRTGPNDSAPWVFELLVDLPPQERPAPFAQQEHVFTSLDEARQWLGAPQAMDEA